MPSEFHASDPSASLCTGTPNSTNARTPRSRISAASLRSDSIVCWACPGIDEIGVGSSIPSFTNNGAIRSAGRTSVSRTSSRRATVRRRRRGRCSGKLIGASVPGATDRPAVASTSNPVRATLRRSPLPPPRRKLRHPRELLLMMISFRTAAVGALALATLSIVVQPAGAAVSTGYLDHTFSDDGKVLTNVAGDDTGAAVAVQAHRKVVVAGTTHGGTDIALVRYNTDGTLAPSSDRDGIVIRDLSGDDAAFAVAIQADGKILVGGFTDDGVSAALLRYDTDGTLDSTFGGGDGVATISAGTGAVFVGIAIQSDDSIVAAGMGNFTGFFGGDALVARFDPSGVPDASFGGGDGTTTKKIGFGGFVGAVGLASDGASV